VAQDYAKAREWFKKAADKGLDWQGTSKAASAAAPTSWGERGPAASRAADAAK
jgi:TPR repeat protein